MIWVSIWRSLTLYVAFLALCPRFESLFYAFIDRYLPDYVIRVCRQRRLTDSWQPAMSVIQTFNFERLFGNFSESSHGQMLHTPRATSSESSSKECLARAHEFIEMTSSTFVSISNSRDTTFIWLLVSSLSRQGFLAGECLTQGSHLEIFYILFLNLKTSLSIYLHHWLPNLNSWF